MRILHLLASPAWTGPAENIALLALEQQKLGHEVTVAIDRKRSRLPDEEPLMPRLDALKLLDNSGLELSVKSLPWAWVRDIRTLKKLNVDVVHSHFSHDHFIARFGTPRTAKLIRSVHAPRSLKGLPRAHAYTASSEKDALPAAPKRVLQALLASEFVPPADKPALRRDLALSGNPLVGMVSHLMPSRNHDLALRAFAELQRVAPEARLVLVGDGPLRAELEMQASSLGVNPNFAGYKSGADFVRYLQALDVVWILGLGNDFTARAARQARACGVRVVAVDEGALSQWADAVVPKTAEAIAVATADGTRRNVSALSNEDIARDILSLYEEAKAR